MKKVLSILIVAVLLVAMIPTTAFAATAPKITATANDTTVSVGDVVTVTVKVPANSNLVAFTYALKFDTSYFQLVSGSATTNSVFGYEMTNDKIAGEFRYIGATNSSVTAAGTLFTVKFKILKTGGKINCDVQEAYVLSGGRDTDVTSSCASVSTKSISFSAVSVITDYFAIQTPSETKFRYKSGIVLHINQKKTPPSKATYTWSVNNDCFNVEVSEDGKSCEVVANKSGTTVVTVKLVSSAGVTLETETIELKSNAGFFDKIIAFFLSIFGGNKILPQ